MAGTRTDTPRPSNEELGNTEKAWSLFSNPTWIDKGSEAKAIADEIASGEEAKADENENTEMPGRHGKHEEQARDAKDAVNAMVQEGKWWLIDGWW